MVGVVVATHGRLGEELLATAATVCGALAQARSVSISSAQSMEESRAALGAAIGAVEQGQGVLVLTDMFGGTPTNLVLPFAGDGVEVVTGVNLPMLIKACALREGRLPEVARAVREQGKGSIYVASEILEPRRA